MRRSPMVVALLAAALMVGGCGGGSSAAGSSTRPAGVPAAGVSPTIDRILQNGYLKVGVMAGPPWLVQNPTGGTSAWSGPSWTLAQAVSKQLGVPLKLVDVGDDTKVTSVQTGQIDISITPLNETDKRKKVVDFITYSVDGYCWFALQSNNKVSSVADFNKGGIVDAEVSGGAEVSTLPTIWPNLKIMQYVAAPGEVYALEPVLSGRADIAGFDAPLVGQIQHQYPQLKFIPDPQTCIAKPLLPIQVGWAIRQGDPAFKSFLEGIEKPMQSQLDKETSDIIAHLSS
ncbi:transporter substrate-binding domain-containing protein [bacterium]|nr:MAG: transporter substrate-binding domain-containing protein [bacterium]